MFVDDVRQDCQVIGIDMDIKLIAQIRHPHLAHSAAVPQTAAKHRGLYADV